MRIITGTFKGRRLATPTWEGLRPTSDRLRETLFNVLAGRVDGARVLDGYCGTGAVGIEALSRGAAHVTFVDRDPRATALVERNLATCRADSESPRRYTVKTADMTAFRPAPGAAWTLVVLDPPYADTRVHETLERLRPAMDAGGVLVLEHARRQPPDVPAGWRMSRCLESGDSALTFLHPSPDQP